MVNSFWIFSNMKTCCLQRLISGFKMEINELRYIYIYTDYFMVYQKQQQTKSQSFTLTIHYDYDNYCKHWDNRYNKIHTTKKDMHTNIK